MAFQYPGSPNPPPTSEERTRSALPPTSSPRSFHPPQFNSIPQYPTSIGPTPSQHTALNRATRPNPQVFGHIVGAPPGTQWNTRRDVSQAGVHGPPQSGIAGTAERGGAESVVLNDGYHDGDCGDIIWYMGSGGFMCDGKKKSTMQADQNPNCHFNLALQASLRTRNPVRVIRGADALHSPWAPLNGYRYDGLYEVTRFDFITDPSGNTDYLCLIFRMERLERDRYTLPIKSDHYPQALSKSNRGHMRKREEDNGSNTPNDLLQRSKDSRPRESLGSQPRPTQLHSPQRPLPRSQPAPFRQSRPLQVSSNFNQPTTNQPEWLQNPAMKQTLGQMKFTHRKQTVPPAGSERPRSPLALSAETPAPERPSCPHVPSAGHPTASKSGTISLPARAPSPSRSQPAARPPTHTLSKLPPPLALQISTPQTSHTAHQPGSKCFPSASQHRSSHSPPSPRRSPLKQSPPSRNRHAHQPPPQPYQRHHPYTSAGYSYQPSSRHSPPPRSADPRPRSTSYRPFSRHSPPRSANARPRPESSYQPLSRLPLRQSPVPAASLNSSLQSAPPAIEVVPRNAKVGAGLDSYPSHSAQSHSPSDSDNQKKDPAALVPVQSANSSRPEALLSPLPCDDFITQSNNLQSQPSRPNSPDTPGSPSSSMSLDSNFPAPGSAGSPSTIPTDLHVPGLVIKKITDSNLPAPALFEPATPGSLSIELEAPETEEDFNLASRELDVDELEDVKVNIANQSDPQPAAIDPSEDFAPEGLDIDMLVVTEHDTMHNSSQHFEVQAGSHECNSQDMNCEVSDHEIEKGLDTRNQEERLGVESRQRLRSELASDEHSCEPTPEFSSTDETMSGDSESATTDECLDGIVIDRSRLAAQWTAGVGTKEPFHGLPIHPDPITELYTLQGSAVID